MLPAINFPLEQPKKLCFIYIQTGFSGNLLQMVNNPEAHPDVQYTGLEVIFLVHLQSFASKIFFR